MDLCVLIGCYPSLHFPQEIIYLRYITEWVPIPKRFLQNIKQIFTSISKTFSNKKVTDNLTQT